MLDRWIPRSAIGAAATAIGVTIALFHVTVVGTEVLQSYGWGLFVALPFCLGCSRAGVQLPRATIVRQLHERCAVGHRVAGRKC